MRNVRSASKDNNSELRRSDLNNSQTKKGEPNKFTFFKYFIVRD